jgi:acyl carrier protein/SAM-dependent methyltransferase
MIRVLDEDRIIRLEDGQVHILKSSHEVEDSERLHRELEIQYPQFTGLLQLLRHCARHYPEALSGKIEAIGVLYPDGSSQFLDDCAKNTIEYRNGRIYHLLLREIIDNLANKSPGGKLRILEVGGGRGALTRLIAPVLKDRNVEYHFSDIGKTFVVQAQAEAKKSGFDFMKFGLLDISKDPLEQGYGGSSFDIVLGLDVVHATPTIEGAIRNLKSLLSRNGRLLLIEGVKPERWIDMIWGLAEGWWYFTDTDLRTTSPLLSLEKWEEVFRKQGFEDVQGYPQDEDERSETDTGLIVGRKPGTVRVGGRSGDRATDTGDVSARILKVKELEELGAEVLVASADVSNFDQMRSLIKNTKERFGEINGVIHAAGIEGGGLIQSMTREKIEQEFAAKVRGTLVLDVLFENEKLDFFVLCSSHSALTGSLGQVGYCAANSFLDGFANFKASQESDRTISVNWGRWKNVGMAVGVEKRHKAITGEDIEEQMTANEGLRAFTHLLSSKCVPQLVVSTQDFQALAALSDRRQQPVVGKLEQAPLTSSTHGRPTLESAYIAPDNEVEQTIAIIWQEVLGIERVGIRDNFFDLGGDSLIAIQVLSRLRKRFAVDLPVTSLFDSPTVSDLAMMVVQKQLAQVDSEKLAQVLAEIKQLSKDKITEMLTSEENVVGEKES